jgi:hypothetical protein
MKKRVHDSDEETTAKRIKLDPSIVVEKYFSKEYLKPASEELQKSYSVRFQKFWSDCFRRVNLFATWPSKTFQTRNF